MSHRLRHVPLVLLVAAAVAIPTAHAAGGTAVVRPSYTPAELKALIAYSKASFAAKQAILAGRGPVTAPLAGPWYTAAERQALVAYANASPAQRRALPARTTGASFHWGDALGAGLTTALVALAGVAALLRRHRVHRRGLGNDAGIVGSLR